MGITLAFLSAFSYAVANIFWKKAAKSGDLMKGFVAQYGFVAALSVVFGLLSGQMFFGFDAKMLPFVAILWISGYTGIYAYLVSSRYMPMGTALAIAYGYVVALYFVNAELFPGVETLSMAKLAFAGAFFLSIAAFLVHANRIGAAFLKHVWLPCVSFVCWIVYFGCANYVVKTGVASPAWSLFLAEGSIFTVAAIAIGGRMAYRKIQSRKESLKTKDSSVNAPAPSGFIYGIFMAVFLALGTGLLLVSYDLIAANLANTIGLSTTFMNAVLAFLVYRERLPKSDWVFMFVSTAFLSGFLIVK